MLQQKNLPFTAYCQRQILFSLFFLRFNLSIIIQGQTALHIACGSRSTDVALLLVDRGADVNLADHEVSSIQ